MGTAHPKGWSWQRFGPAVPSGTQGSAISSGVGRQKPGRSASSLAKAVSTCGRRPDPTGELTQLRWLAGTMPPPRRRGHPHPPRALRPRQTPTNSALPNSGLGSAEPSVRWINRRACPGSGSSFAIDSTSMSDRRSERSSRSDSGFTASPLEAASKDARLSPHPLRRRRSDAHGDPFCRAPSGLRPGDFVGLDRPRQTKRSPASDRRQELLLLL